MNTKLLALTLAALTLTSFASCAKEEAAEPEAAEQTQEVETAEETAPSGGYSLANPWKTATQEDVKAQFGVTFNVPKDAADVIYRINTISNMAEMQFTLDGVKWNARIAEAEAAADISGMHYVWSTTNTLKLGKIEGTVKTATSDNKNIGAGLWFNEPQKLMYSLTGTSEKTLDFSVAVTVFPT